jgi:type III secretion protein U
VSGEKTEPASRKRLEELRKRGEFAYSAELVRTAALLGGLAALLATWPRFATALSEYSAYSLRGDATAAAAIAVGIQVLGMGALPMLGGAVVGAAAASLAQTGFSLVPDRLAPNLSRFAPFSSIAERWRMDALLRGAIALGTAVVGAALVFGVVARMREAAAAEELMAGGPIAVAGAVFSPIWAACAALVGVAVVAGVADRGLQMAAFAKRHRMSRQELRDEAKESEGNPEVRAQRRRMHRELATGAIREGVARADVLVRNPTHVAVGLRYRKADGDAPIVTIVGAGETARRIVREAQRRRLPEVTDVKTARACIDVPVGEPIPEGVFEPVAVIFRWLIDEGLIDPAGDD